MNEEIRKEILRITEKYPNKQFFLKDWAKQFNVPMSVIYEVCDKLLEDGYLEEYCKPSILIT